MKYLGLVLTVLTLVGCSSTVKVSDTWKDVKLTDVKDKKVMVNTSQLSELDAQHDYQMWADVEGEMINMGVINTEEPLIAMTYIEDAESLNVTIEPKGGSDHPTVSRLITNVYLN